MVWIWIIAGWLVLAVCVAVIIGRMTRFRDRQKPVERPWEADGPSDSASTG